MKITKYISNFISKFCYHINYYQAIHSIKTAVACLVGLLLVQYYNLPYGQWISIITMVIMGTQIHFEGALQKSYMRFLGTISGIIIAITVLWFFDNQNSIAIFCALFVSIAIFTYIASDKSSVSYAGIVGGITVLFTLGGQNTTIEVVIQRGIYTVIGISIALLVSRIIFPIHLYHGFYFKLAKIFRNLQKLYSQTIQLTHKHDITQNAIIYELANNITTDIFSQSQILDNLTAEKSHIAKNKVLLTKVIDSQRKLYRFINLLYIDLYEHRKKGYKGDDLIFDKDINSIVDNRLGLFASFFEKLKISYSRNLTDLNKDALLLDHLIEKTMKKNQKTEVIDSSSYCHYFLLNGFLKEVKSMGRLIDEVNSKNKNNMI